MARIDNNYFTYRETPTTENGTGTLVDIKGQTLKWNQLVYNGNFTSTDGWAGENSNPTLSVADNAITVTMTSGSPSLFNPAIRHLRQYNFDANHKYLFSFDFKATKAGVCLYYRSSAFFGGGLNFFPILQSANTWTSYKNIVTATDTENFLGYFGLSYTSDSGITVGDSFSLRNLMIIDLTVLGIADKTDAEILQWFADYFPLSYYSFNSGSLIPFMGNGIKTVGKNLLDPSSKTTYDGENGMWWYESQGFMLMANKTYTFSASNTNGASVTVYFIDHATRTTLASGVLVTTYTPTQNVNVYLQAYRGAGIPSETEFQLEFGSTATSYEPYTESVINLPISTYFPTGMKEVNVYDELTPSKATTRIGEVTVDGTNTGIGATALTNVMRITVPFTTAKYNSNQISNNLPFLVSYTSDTEHFYLSDTYINLFIDKTKCGSTLNSVKQYLGNNPTIIYYELATPIETAISPELDLTFNIDKGGTEELLPSGLLNGSVDLGSLTWVLDNGAFRSTSGIPNMVQPQASVKGNIMCPMYRTTSQSAIYATANNMCISGLSYTNNVLVRNDSFTSASDFKNAMQGIMLWYETTDSTPTTTPILCDILYRGLIPVSVTVYPLGAGTVEGAGQYRYGETVTLVAESSDGIYRFLRYEDENGDTLSTDATYSFIAGE